MNSHVREAFFNGLLWGGMNMVGFLRGMQSAALCTFAVILAGCAAVPQKDFKAYRDAFDLAKSSSQEVLLDYSAAKADLEKRAAKAAAEKKGPPPQPSLYQFNYQPTTSRAAAKAEAVAERVRALEAIARYNQVLADLAEGKSVSQVASSASQLLQTLGSVITIVPAAGPLLTNLATAIEKARVRDEFVKAVRIGEEPVGKILDFFMDEIPLYYQIRRDLTLLDLNAIASRINLRAGALESAAGSLEPTAAVNLSAYQAEINQQLGRLTDMGRRISLVAGGAAAVGKPATTAGQATLTNAVLEDARIAFTADASAYLVAVDKLNAYMSLLQRYEMLLNSTRQAMSALRLAVDSPQDIAPQMEDLLQTALLLRRDFIKFRNSN